MKAVAVYLKYIEIERTVCEVSLEIIPCACYWSVGNHNHFKER